MLRQKLFGFIHYDMKNSHVWNYENIWSTLFKTYILPSISAVKDIEIRKQYQLLSFINSETSYYNFDELNSWEHPVLNIDIREEKTNITVFKENQPDFSTSFRFAENTVFGDAYNASNHVNNGFVKLFIPIVQNFLENNKSVLNELYDVFVQMTNEYSNAFGSQDLMAFFFS